MKPTCLIPDCINPPIARDWVVLGPANCQDCRQPVYWDGRRWCDANHWRHRCEPIRRCLRCRKAQPDDMYLRNRLGVFRVCQDCRERYPMTPAERRRAAQLSIDEYRSRKAA